MNFTFRIFPCTLVLLIAGCYYDNEAELYGIQECIQVEANFEQVNSIIKNNCTSCHNPSLPNGGVNLEGYESIKSVAENGTLIGVITHDAGYPPMPKNGPQLNDCDITSIRQWIENGALNE